MDSWRIVGGIFDISDKVLLKCTIYLQNIVSNILGNRTWHV